MPILPYSAATRKHTMVGQKYFKERGQTSVMEGQKYTTYNKINNNSENFRRSKIAAKEGFALPSPLSCGPAAVLFVVSDIITIYVNHTASYSV